MSFVRPHVGTPVVGLRPLNCKIHIFTGKCGLLPAVWSVKLLKQQFYAQLLSNLWDILGLCQIFVDLKAHARQHWIEHA